MLSGSRSRWSSILRIAGSLAVAAAATAAVVSSTAPAASALKTHSSPQRVSHAVARSVLHQSAPLPATWPARVWQTGIGRVAFSSPTVAEIDGVRAVVIGSLTGYVYVMNATTGQELPGWPQPVDIAPGHPSAVDSTPTVAYLDGPDKPPTIIVGAGSLYVANQQGGVEAWYASGQVRFVFHTKATFNEWTGGPPNGYANSVFSSPAVGDITGNGQMDIVFGSYDHYIYALQPDGQLVPGFPFWNQDTVWSSPALYDPSGSGHDDIYIGADSTGLHGCYGGWVYDLRWWGNAVHVMWSLCRPQAFWSSPAIGHINASGRAAVVIGTSWDGAYYTPGDSDLVYAFYADDGQPVPGWPVHTSGPTFASPAIGDLLGNGQEDVVVASGAHYGPAVVSAYNGAGGLMWSCELNQYELLASPVLVDLMSDGGEDVIVGNALGEYLLAGSNGYPIYSTGTHPLVKPCAVQGSAAVTNIPNVGWRLYVACGGPLYPGSVNAFPFAVGPKSPPAWPMFRMDTLHTGVDPPSEGPPTVHCSAPPEPIGYRFVAADGGVFDFANMPFCGSTGSMYLPSPVVGLAETPDGGGYWIATADGSVYTFGNAQFYGSMQGQPLAGQIAGIASDLAGNGYWLVGADGSVYPFGGAPNYGSQAAHPPVTPVVAISLDRQTGGYWLATAGGGIFNFNAPNYGSMGGHVLNRPVVGLTSNLTGTGYWMVASDGGIFAFGGVHFLGSMGGQHLNQPIVGMATDNVSGGYWLVARDGGIFSFGAKFYGSTGNLHLNQPIVGMSTV